MNPPNCPICNQANPWQMGEARLGRIGSKITIWAEVTECAACGYHFMTDEQCDQADQQLLAVENTYDPGRTQRTA